MSLFTDGLPAWWAMAVAVAALLVGVWLGELHGRGVGRGQEREDRKAEHAARQVRSWRVPSEVVPPATREEAMARRTHPVYRQRRTSTAAFLRPVLIEYEDRPPAFFDEHDLAAIAAAEIPPEIPPEVAHEAWLAHTEQAMDLANDDPTVSAWTQEMAQSMDAFLAGLLAEHPIPYLPGEEER
jgi:hypothetical protein